MLNASQISMRQKGFTLIEMSIVLVIIGLIIGGILKGQELINTSRQKNLVTQIDGIRSAINTFNDKYNSLPGSFAQATTRIAPQAVNGLGLGIVGVNSATTAAMVAISASVAGGAGGATAAANTNEPAVFWCQLAITGLVGGSSSNCATAPTSFGNGSFLPSTAYSGAGLSVAYGTADSATTGEPRNSLWLRMHRTAGVPSAGISGRNMAEIDAKFDDGLPATGSIRSGNAATECPNATAQSVYLVVTAAADSPTCILFADLVK